MAADTSQASDASQAKAMDLKAAMERGRLPDGLGGIVTFNNQKVDENKPRFDYIKIGDVKDIGMVLDSEKALTQDDRLTLVRMEHTNGRAYMLLVFARVETGKFKDTT